MEVAFEKGEESSEEGASHVSRCGKGIRSTDPNSALDAQWNLSIADSFGTSEGVLNIEIS